MESSLAQYRKLADALAEKMSAGQVDGLDDGNADVFTDLEALRSAAQAQLLEFFEIHGEDAADVLSELHPHWSADRVYDIAMNKANPTQQEILEHSNVILEGDDEIRYTVLVGLRKIAVGGEIVAWAVIREDGIALDRSYSVDGVFLSEAEAKQYISEKYA